MLEMRSRAPSSNGHVRLKYKDDNSSYQDLDNGSIGTDSSDAVVSGVSGDVIAGSYPHDIYHDEEDEGEGEALVSVVSIDRELSEFGDERLNWRCVGFGVLVIMFIISVVVEMLPGRKQEVVNQFGHHGGSLYNDNDLRGHDVVGAAVQYDCPAGGAIGNARNYENTSIEQDYKDDTKLIAGNLTSFLETFRDKEFDNWGTSYNKVKQGMYHWKATHFPHNLKDGDSIFESACGIGLNLIMTLEIIKEVGDNEEQPDYTPIRDLMVYGNEYIQTSADTANQILDRLLPDLGATKGSVCAADSTDLSFIPSDSFDLVFTGYISTLLDPLTFDEPDIDTIYEKYYQDLCEADDWKSKKLNQIAQERQEDWFGKWVSEMIRIAKPGSPIMIEQVGQPFCDAYFDWGGVTQDYWHRAVRKYNWDVDIDSIEMEDDRIFRRRYHVFMRKNQTLEG